MNFVAILFKVLLLKCDIKLDGFSPNLLVELRVAKILGETQSSIEPNILKLIARLVNISRKSSNFIIIMCRIQYYQISVTSNEENWAYSLCENIKTRQKQQNVISLHENNKKMTCIGRKILD